MPRSVHAHLTSGPSDDRPPGDVPPPPAPPHAVPPCSSAPSAVSFGRLCLRRPRAALALLVCVAQVWLLHGVHVLRCRLRARFQGFTTDDGMTTAEYAVGTVSSVPRF